MTTFSKIKVVIETIMWSNFIRIINPFSMRHHSPE